MATKTKAATVEKPMPPDVEEQGGDERATTNVSVTVRVDSGAGFTAYAEAGNAASVAPMGLNTSGNRGVLLLLRSASGGACDIQIKAQAGQTSCTFDVYLHEQLWLHGTSSTIASGCFTFTNASVLPTLLTADAARVEIAIEGTGVGGSPNPPMSDYQQLWVHKHGVALANDQVGFIWALRTDAATMIAAGDAVDPYTTDPLPYIT